MQASTSSDLLSLYAANLLRKCSRCGKTGHNSRTCLETRSYDVKTESKADSVGEKVKEEVEVSDGSDHKAKSAARKKGVAWTEEEHKQFLSGLAKLGKGNWRGISRHFVQTKSPTQVASHAQKYFIRQTVAGKRKRRSSLFDLVPENEVARDPEMRPQAQETSSAAVPIKAERPTENTAAPEQTPPAIPSMQGAEALAWAYWYQSMMMQNNPWMASLPSAMQNAAKSGPSQPQAPVPPVHASGGTPMPAMFPPMGKNEADPNNPAFAAYLAQQSQMAAMMAMQYMPQLPPEYLARYAAGLQIHTQAAEAAQQAAQSARSSKENDDKLNAEGLADDNLSSLEETPSQTADERDEEPASKFPRRSENASRFDLSNASTETEEFGNGALFRPKAQKVKSWAELPSFLQDRKAGSSMLNSNSKQSTQVAGPQMTALTHRSPAFDTPALSSQNHRTTNSASTAVEGPTPSTANDPNLATSHYKAQSEISKSHPTHQRAVLDVIA